MLVMPFAAERIQMFELKKYISIYSTPSKLVFLIKKKYFQFSVMFPGFFTNPYKKREVTVHRKSLSLAR